MEGSHVPFDRELINELNMERHELTNPSQVKFSHPDRTHDDSEAGWKMAAATATPWAFYVGSPKSAALKGPDLRTKDPRVSWKEGFPDRAGLGSGKMSPGLEGMF